MGRHLPLSLSLSLSLSCRKDRKGGGGRGVRVCEDDACWGVEKEMEGGGGQEKRAIENNTRSKKTHTRRRRPLPSGAVRSPLSRRGGGNTNKERERAGRGCEGGGRNSPSLVLLLRELPCRALGPRRPRHLAHHGLRVHVARRVRPLLGRVQDGVAAVVEGLTC